MRIMGFMRIFEDRTATMNALDPVYIRVRSGMGLHIYEVKGIQRKPGKVYIVAGRDVTTDENA